jgi:oxalate decarboxylase/phosphoglucose isomerase-like protein (cupin superfamily)
VAEDGKKRVRFVEDRKGEGRSGMTDGTLITAPLEEGTKCFIPKRVHHCSLHREAMFPMFANEFRL